MRPWKPWTRRTSHDLAGSESLGDWTLAVGPLASAVVEITLPTSRALVLAEGSRSTLARNAGLTL